MIDNRYRIIQKVGEGACAQVYLVEDTAGADRRLGLKLLRGNTARELERFRREFGWLVRLRHPNVLRVHDFGSTGDGAEFYFTYDFIAGQNLAEFAAEASVDEILEITVGVLRGLEFIHSRGLIHYDIKPENILVTRDSETGLLQAVITDFGLAGEVHTEAGHTVKGTPHTMAPEIAKGRPVDRRADLYSLGATLYHALCGQPPYVGSSVVEILRRHIDDRAVPPSERRPDLPEGLDRVILKLLEKEPAHRPASANAVITELAQALGREFELETDSTRESRILGGQLVGRDRQMEWLQEVFETVFSSGSAGCDPEGADSYLDPRDFDRRIRLRSRLTPGDSAGRRRGAGDRRSGREDGELDLDLDVQPHANLVLVSGESGIGKSRLIGEFKHQVQLCDVAFLEATCRKHADGAFGPFVDVVAKVARLVEDDAHDLISFEWAVRQLLDESRAGEEGVAAGDLDVAGQRLLDGVAEYLLAVSRQRPLVIAIEDLHWASSDTLALLVHLHRLVNTRFAANSADAEGAAGLEVAPNLLVLGTYRPEELEGSALAECLGEMRQDRHFEELRLRSLTVDDTTALARSMTGATEVPLKFSARLNRETGGNPLYVEEVMRVLAEDGLLDSAGGRRAGVKAGKAASKGGSRFGRLSERATLASARTMTAAIQKRIRGLESTDRCIVEAIGALERPADCDLIARVVGLESEEVVARLQVLEQRGILAHEIRRARSLVGAGATQECWAVAQQRVRDVIYESVSDVSDLHLRVGQALEAGAAQEDEGSVDSRDLHGSEIARHLLHAGAGWKAVSYGVRAARRARRIGASGCAVELLEATVTALEGLRGTDGSDDLPHPTTVKKRHLEVLAELGVELYRFGRVREAHRRDLEALDLARELSDSVAEVEALERIGRGSSELNELGDARRYFNESLAKAEGLDFRRGVGSSLRALSDLTAVEGDMGGALDYLQRLVEVERKGGAESRELARTQRALAMALRKEGRNAEALSCGEKALEISRRLSDKKGEAEAYDVLSDIYFYLGDYDRSIDATNRAVEMHRELGNKSGEAEALYTLGILFDQRGHLADAVTHFRDSARLWRQLGNQGELARALHNLGWNLYLQGETRRALAALNEATTLFNTRDERESYANGLVALGLCYTRVGDLKRAAGCLDGAIRVAGELGVRSLEAEGTWVQGELKLELGEPGAARECFDRVVRLAREDGSGRLETLGLSSMASALARTGEVSRARELAQRAQDLASSAGEADVSARTRLRSAEVALAERDLHAALAGLEGRETWLVDVRERAVQLEAELAWARLRLAVGDAEQAAEALSAVVDEAGRLDYRGVRVEARVLCAAARLAAQRSAAEWRPGRRLPLADGLLAARRDAEQALAEAREIGRRGAALRATLVLAEIDVVAGEEERARDQSRALREDPRFQRDIHARVRAGLVAAQASLVLERAEEARAEAEALAAETRSTGSPALEAERLLVSGQAALEAGEPHAARDSLQRAVELLERAIDGLPEAEQRVRRAAPDVQAACSSLAEIEACLAKGRVAEVESSPAEVSEDAASKAEAVSALALDGERQRLLKLMQAANEINSEETVERQLERLLDVAVDVFRAERGFVILIEKAGFQVKAARNFDGEAISKPEHEISRTIARKVALRGSPLIAMDAAQDLAIHESASVADLRLRSVMCVPLRVKSVVRGVLYVDHRFDEARFSRSDLELCEALSNMVAVVIERTRLGREAEVSKEEVHRTNEEIQRLNRKLEGEVVSQSTEISRMQVEIHEQAEQLKLKYSYANIVGSSAPMRGVFQLLDKVTDSDVPVLVQGESGTGKELVARAVHYNGVRKDRPFLSINCAALADSLLEAELFGYVKGAFTGATQNKLGLFECADGGTLFLDEIGDMSPNLQSKLLRVLQDGEVRPVGGKTTRRVSVRIISASNKDLRKLVEEGRFRSDLYYRINVVTLWLPPLRERRDDIPLLVDYLLAHIEEGKGKTLDRKLMDHLLSYHWPGNVRELENELRRLVALSGARIGEKDLSPHIRKRDVERYDIGHAEGLTLKQKMEIIERRILVSALKRQSGNKTKTAKALGLSRFGFLKKLDKYNLR